MILFDRLACVSICLKNKNPYVALAVEDLRQDFKRVNAASVMPEYVSEESSFCIVIEENALDTADGETVKATRRVGIRAKREWRIPIGNCRVA